MITVTLIRPRGCAHCAQATTALEKLRPAYPDLVIEEVDALSSSGQALIQKYQILTSPGILVNGEFFTMGGATEAQFRARFDALLGRR